MSLLLNITKFKELQSRESLNMSETSRKLGISRSQLWRILNNQCTPGEQFIAGFKKAFPAESFDQFFLLEALQQSDTQTTA